MLEQLEKRHEDTWRADVLAAYVAGHRAPPGAPSCGSPAPMARTPQPATPGLRPDRTSSTIRRRNSGEYGVWLFGIVDLLLPSVKDSHGTGATPVFDREPEE